MVSKVTHLLFIREVSLVKIYPKGAMVKIGKDPFTVALFEIAKDSKQCK